MATFQPPESPEAHPFRMTKKELASLDPNYKKTRKKASVFGVAIKASEAKRPDPSSLHEASTISSKLKQRVSDRMDDIWDELDNMSGNADLLPEWCDELDDVAEEDGGIGDDPTYELATARRFIEGYEPVSQTVLSCRKMFLLQYLLSVKRRERMRLDKELRNEELKLHKSETALRLAEQAFDQFLQENDRNAVQAMKSAERETRLRIDKSSELKQMDNRINALKKSISKLKDSLLELGTYQGFLYWLSPESWRQQQTKTFDEKTVSSILNESLDEQSIKNKPDGSEISGGGHSEDDDVTLATILSEHLSMDSDEIAKAKGKVTLYFQDPQELLGIFSSLEDENLGLIQECREAENDLEELKATIKETKCKLSQQAENFESEITKLEQTIESEKALCEEMWRLKDSRSKEEEATTEQRKVADALELKDLAAKVEATHLNCVGMHLPDTPTLELLKSIELMMENLTQQLERFTPQNVKMAQKACERERRLREHQARLELQRVIKEQRNQRALQRALAPPFLKPELRKFMRKVLVRKTKKSQLQGRSGSSSSENDIYYT